MGLSKLSELRLAACIHPRAPTSPHTASDRRNTRAYCRSSPRRAARRAARSPHTPSAAAPRRPTAADTRTSER